MPNPSFRPARSSQSGPRRPGAGWRWAFAHSGRERLTIRLANGRGRGSKWRRRGMRRDHHRVHDRPRPSLRQNARQGSAGTDRLEHRPAFQILRQLALLARFACHLGKAGGSIQAETCIEVDFEREPKPDIHHITDRKSSSPARRGAIRYSAGLLQLTTCSRAEAWLGLGSWLLWWWSSFRKATSPHAPEPPPTVRPAGSTPSAKCSPRRHRHRSP